MATRTRAHARAIAKLAALIALAALWIAPIARVRADDDELPPGLNGPIKPRPTPPAPPKEKPAPPPPKDKPVPPPKDKPAPRAQAQKAGAHDGMTGDMDCDACHTSTSWKLSASAGKSGFDHDKTGFPLRGSHVQTACTGCHTGGRALMSTCDSCHRDPHQGRMDGQCYECHTAVAWADVQQLEQHRRTRMPLTGKHAIVECNACHKRQAERTFTDLPVDCYACHSTEYHASTTHPNHDGTDPKVQKAPFPRDCGQCHNPIGWTPAFASTATVMPRVQAAREHDPFFQLTTGSHRAFDCASCHPDTARPHAVRCDGCHLSSELRTQHRQPIAASVGQACLRCHVRGARR